MVFATHEGQISQSTDVQREFYASMNSAVLADQSVVGKLRVLGADGLDLLHRLSTNDIRGLKAFTSAGTIFTTEKGRLVDFARVLATAESTLLVTSPLLAGKLKQWIEKYIIMEEIRVVDITDDIAAYSIIGPQAIVAGEKVLKTSLVQGGVCRVEVANTEILVDVDSDFHLTRLNLLVPKETSGLVWAKLKEEMDALSLPVMGYAAYEVFRIYHGIPLGGSELCDAFNPYDVGLSRWISATKGCFIGQEVIARLDTYDKIQRKPVLIGFRRVPATPLERLHLMKDGDDIGILTSISKTPVNEEYFAIGIVSKNKVLVGNTLTITVDGTEFNGIVTKIFNHSTR